MKKRIVMILCAAMIAGIFPGCGGAVSSGQDALTEETTLAATDPTEETDAPAETEVPVAATNEFRIALIAVDRMDKHWLDLEMGAMTAAEELGCEVVNLSPLMKDDEQQIGGIREAVASGCDAIVIAANDDSDAVTAALQEAAAAGVKIVCVDRPANFEADALVCTDDKLAGRAAGEAMMAELKKRGITEGAIGIIGMNPDTGFSAQREAGFREAFDGKAYTLMETQYSEGDAAKAHTISKAYIDQEAAGIFCCSEGCTVGAGNAVKESGAQAAVVGFGESEVIMDLINEGGLLASVAQNPDTMGYEAVKAACAVLHGRNLGSAVVDTGATVLTK